MLLAGGIIVVLTFALIIKKIEARLVLFLAGVIMCLIGGLPGDIMKAFMKAMTNNSLVLLASGENRQIVSGNFRQLCVR